MDMVAKAYNDKWWYGYYLVHFADTHIMNIQHL
jgi:hypothetical protein